MSKFQNFSNAQKMKRMNSDFQINDKIINKNDIFRNSGRMLIDFSNENIYKSRNYSQRNQISEIYNSNQKKYDKIFFGSEESLIDKRFNNLKYNLIPKNSNKNTNRTEYNNQYISYPSDNIIDEGGNSNRFYSNPKKIKNKIDVLDNYNIPEKLKKEVRSIDEIDDFNYNNSLAFTSPIKKYNVTKNNDDKLNNLNNIEKNVIFSRRKNHEIDPGGNQRLNKNNNNKNKSLSPVFRGRTKKNNYLLDNHNLKKINLEEESNFIGEELKKKHKNLNNKFNDFNLEKNEVGIDGGENPIAGEDIDGIIYKKTKGKFFKKIDYLNIKNKEENKIILSGDLPNGESIFDRGLDGGENPFAGDNKKNENINNPIGFMTTKSDVINNNNFKIEPGFNPIGINDIENKKPGGNNPYGIKLKKKKKG